ncbi:exosortase K [Geosporobacter ferrireducens]|uniref:Exosortase K n=1 Tax=Geosporobacter ferrireducens TaxID=1424294 RepID=A0A1D8GES0_9FIRM|nr:exosortase K [Geosporobacter ferrireducens]AOT69388.1 exosortase K [Geosporobacter ferrireducens]
MERQKARLLALVVLYLCMIGAAFRLYLLYRYGSVEDLLFIIKPVAFLVEKALGIRFYYDQDLGFVSQQGNVVINQACSGIRFWIAVYCMLGFSFVSRVKSIGKKYMMTFGFVLFSYGITIFANASRIITAIGILNLAIVESTTSERFLHQSIGVLFYWIYLCIIYVLFEKLIRKEGKYEKAV